MFRRFRQWFIAKVFRYELGNVNTQLLEDVFDLSDKLDRCTELNTQLLEDAFDLSDKLDRCTEFADRVSEQCDVAERKLWEARAHAKALEEDREELMDQLRKTVHAELEARDKLDQRA